MLLLPGRRKPQRLVECSGDLGPVVAAVIEKRCKSQGQDDLQAKEQLGKQVWLWRRTMLATFSLAADPGWAMKVLLLTGLRALYSSPITGLTTLTQVSA